LRVKRTRICARRGINKTLEVAIDAEVAAELGFQDFEQQADRLGTTPLNGYV
jgi:hypothetical protein